MKNDYEIQGEVTRIFLKRKDGTNLETLIDTEDLEKVLKFPNAWYPTFSKGNSSFYVNGKIVTNRKAKRYYLHRWIMDTPENMVVDHINHNTLDNRKSNLRNVTHAVNMSNKKCPRNMVGVSWHKHKKKWIAYYFEPGGKQRHIGYFSNKLDAELSVKKAGL